MSETDYPCTIAFDFTLMRPGCVIVQSVLGTTIGSDQLARFDDWLTSVTPDMKIATLFSPRDMDRAVKLCEEVHGR